MKRLLDIAYWGVILFCLVYLVSCDRIDSVNEEIEEVSEYGKCYVTHVKRGERHGLWQTEFIYQTKTITEPTTIYEDEKTRVYVFCDPK